MKIKIPIKNLEKEDVMSKVEEFLSRDRENAYTIGGIMVEAFKVKQEDIENKSFSSWKKGLPTVYSRIGRCLKRLEERGKVKSKKHERAWVYWYIADHPKRTIRPRD